MKKNVLLCCVWLVGLIHLPSWGQSAYRDDARTKQQQKESVQATRKIKAQADAMEKSRLKQEAAALAQMKRDEKRIAQAKIKEEKAKAALAKAEAKKEADRSKPYKPQVFVAKVPKASK